MRKSARIPVDAPARLHPNSWSSLEVRLLDLSATGFRAACEAKVIIGLAVQLEVPGIGEVEALVSWRRGEQFGARFLKPIDLDRCEWSAGQHETLLAKLLVARAEAQRAGRECEERDLRQQILVSLPIHGGERLAR